MVDSSSPERSRLRNLLTLASNSCTPEYLFLAPHPSKTGPFICPQQWQAGVVVPVSENKGRGEESVCGGVFLCLLLENLLLQNVVLPVNLVVVTVKWILPSSMCVKVRYLRDGEREKDCSQGKENI